MTRVLGAGRRAGLQLRRRLRGGRKGGMRGLSRIVPRTPRRLLWPHRRNPCRGFSELGPLRFHALPAHSHSIADLLLTYWYLMEFSWPHTPHKCRQVQSPRRGDRIGKYGLHFVYTLLAHAFI